MLYCRTLLLHATCQTMSCRGQQHKKGNGNRTKYHSVGATEGWSCHHIILGRLCTSAHLQVSTCSGRPTDSWVSHECYRINYWAKIGCRIEACSKLTHARLDELQLQYLNWDTLSQLTACRSLYLQHNKLTSTATLAALPHLSFLTLSDNQLQQVCRLTIGSCIACGKSSNSHC